jgi:hypothetical protein
MRPTDETGKCVTRKAHTLDFAVPAMSYGIGAVVISVPPFKHQSRIAQLPNVKRYAKISCHRGIYLLGIHK